MPNLFGIPFYLWGLLCLAIAALYLWVWPRPQPGARPRPRWVQVVLRWFHALVWLSAAGACFFWAAARAVPAQALAILALVLYAVFFVTLLRYGR